MNHDMAELEARGIIRNMQGLKMKLNVFAAHAKTLRSMPSGSIDDRMLLEEASHLLRELMTTFKQYEKTNARVGSVSRSLPSRPGSAGIAWKHELRAASTQFLTALQAAEHEVKLLQQQSMDGLNSPLRTPSLPGDPGIDNIVDIVLGFADVLTKWIERRRGHAK